jgi:hypothetical protein
MNRRQRRCGAEWQMVRLHKAGADPVPAPAGTLAYCATAPLDTDFAGLVSAARSWSIADDQLTLSSEDGTPVLRR